MKIVNISNKTLNQRLIIDLCFIAFYNLLVLLLCIFVFNWVTLLICFLFIIFDIFAYKFLKNHYEISDFACNGEIKYIVLNDKEIKICKNNVCEKYNIKDLKSLSLNIETCTYGLGVSYGGRGYHKGCKNIHITFEMHNGSYYKIITHKNTLTEDLNLVYNVIGFLPKQTNFDYSFSGEGISEEIKEKIDYYKEHNKKLINTKKDRKDLRDMALIFLFGGLFVSLFFVIYTWQYILEDFIYIWVFVKLFFIFCIISILIYSPVIIDNIKIRK